MNYDSCDKQNQTNNIKPVGLFLRLSQPRSAGLFFKEKIMKKRKRTILILKIKVPYERMRIVEAKKKNGWSDKDILQFVKGVKSAWPDAVITTSTISKD